MKHIWQVFTLLVDLKKNNTFSSSLNEKKSPRKLFEMGGLASPQASTKPQKIKLTFLHYKITRISHLFGLFL